MRPDRRTFALRRLGLAAAVLAIVVVWLLWQPFAGEGEGEVSVVVPRGAGLSEVADLLGEKGVVSRGFFFEVRARLAGAGSKVKAGTYQLRRGMSYSTALDALTGAGPSERTISVTISEGLSRAEAARAVARAGVKGDYLEATIDSPRLDPGRYGAEGAATLEGFLFPATYLLRRRDGVEVLVRKQLDAFKANLRKVPMAYARSKNLTVFDVLTIAAMVEREVQIPRERKLAAAVIYNRLKAGMPLGIDATVRYAVGNWSRPLRQSELASDSPYNTRKRTGLPPGPIGNPGFEAIKAAANPARVGYLYYVVKPGTCGEHVFTRTDAEFEQARRRYEAAREAAGGRSPTTC